MTFMLASVVDPREAETAVRYGADIVDVKDVRTAFGSVGPSLVRTIVDVLGAYQPISAVIGEPEMEPESVLRRAAAIADAGVLSLIHI